MAQGQARWVLLVSLSQEQQPQYCHPKPQEKNNRHTYNSWLKCQTGHIWSHPYQLEQLEVHRHLLRMGLNIKFHVLKLFFRFVCPMFAHVLPQSVNPEAPQFSASNTMPDAILEQVSLRYYAASS